MRPLGKTKRGRKQHPHDECEICAENDLENKGRDKNLKRKEIEEELKRINDV